MEQRYIAISEENETLVEQKKILFSKKTATFHYPCSNTSLCSPIHLQLIPGLYHFHLCGASGGAPNVAEFSTPEGSPSAGGCIDAEISMKHLTKAFIHLGGKGIYLRRTPGGYNGGGGTDSRASLNGGGGGATDIRFVNNDLFHRVLVSGGGGGPDDVGNLNTNDGRGGCGGGESAQGFWNQSVYNSKLIANQTYGFAFGQGEGGTHQGSFHPDGIVFSNGDERAGAGGGWYGGFCANSFNGGCGGGSSFALTRNSIIPNQEIIIRDQFYTATGKGRYAFNQTSEYLFTEVKHSPGTWYGNGLANITFIRHLQITCRHNSSNHISFVQSLFLVLISSKL